MAEFGLESIKDRLTMHELKQIAEDALTELHRRERSKLVYLEYRRTEFKMELDKVYPNYFDFCAALETMKEWSLYQIIGEM